MMDNLYFSTNKIPRGLLLMIHYIDSQFYLHKHLIKDTLRIIVILKKVKVKPQFFQKYEIF